ncbi:MAG TPA: S8 family serine peptidase [Vicinamibacterales bacterium]|nr:S8 family serine peptidase [Vicinamibacterales bacterium]
MVETAPSALDELLDNARIRSIRPVFVDEQARRPKVAVRRAFLHDPVAPPLPTSRGRGLVTIEVAASEEPQAIARYLASASAEVDYAYVAHPRRMFAAARDPLLSRQWAHTAVRLGDARKRAGFKDASAIIVGVADTGVDTKHPDLSSVVSEYKNFVKGESGRDYEGHGTHVAGILAAGLNNGIGIAGACAAHLLVLKVLPSRAEWDAAGYYRALAYCVGKVRVLNLSLGDETMDRAERDLIADLIEAGIVVVAAMGNAATAVKQYPAALDGVCAVAALDHADRRAPFSNTGSHISVAAPGVAIISTTPTYSYKNGDRLYDAFDGTSAAAPHVAAAAALMLAKDPTLSPAQVIRKLQNSATRVSSMKKRPSPTLGWGCLDIDAALR